jgi:RNA polymerase primary sigma factor
MRKSIREATFRELDKLKSRERRVLSNRSELEGKKQSTLKKISAKIGVSAETVRQIELRALQKLRTHAEDLKLFLDS